MSGNIYQGNPLLKRANISHEWTEDRILEYAKCMNDPVYFAKNYIKIVNVDEGLVNFGLWPFQEKLINNFHQNRFNICLMPRQVGKKLSLDTKIPTVDGWTTVGDLKIGDIIFGRNGKPSKVLGKSEVHQIDTYEVEFDNGEVIKACSEHLWNVSHSDWRHKERVITTKEILKKFEDLKTVKKGSSVYINIAEAIELPEKDLPIDPYTLGVWLGDGSRHHGYLVGVFEDIESISSNIPAKIIKKYNCPDKPNVWKYTYENLYESIKTLGLDKEKSIPEEYLRASISQRLELLRGLMDTDGSVTPNGRCEFYQKDGKLLLQVRELISSLGIKSRLRYKKVPGYNGLYGTIRFCTSKFTVFKLPRKVERQLKNLDHNKNRRLYITDIRKIETEPMQCILVDNPEHLFLCGDTFIPTHNTTTVVSYLLHYLVFNPNVNIGILANKASTSREILGRLQLSYENLPDWMQQGAVAWNKGSVELDNGSKILAASTSASAVRGMSFNIIFLDEFAFVPNHIADEFFASVYPTISSGKSTKVIVVSCVTDDSFILTPKGIYEMSEFIDYEKPENPVIGYEVEDYQVYGHNGIKDGNILVNSGFHDTRIISSPSSSIECSLRHPWFVCDNGKYDWKRTSELTGEEYVAIEYGHDVWDNNDELPQIDLKKYNNNIKPIALTKINSSFAYLLGLYISEGSSVYRYGSNDEKIYRGITITCGDEISGVFDELGLTYSCSDNLHYTISSTVLCDILQELGFDLSKKAKEKEIPKRLFRMSRENIIHMIRGIMDGDGTSKKNRGTVAIGLSSKKLISQIRSILNNFGILSTYNICTTPPTKKVKVSSIQYRLELNKTMSKKYYDLIGFNLERKQLNESYLNDETTRDRCDIIPYSKDIIFSLKESHPNDYKKIIQSRILVGNYKNNHHFSRKFLLKHESFLKSLNNPVINELFEYVSENIKWEPIKSIENSKNRVYDFSLKETGDKWCHSVLFNNILGSNTPKGMNHFYRMWHDAERGKNQFVPTEVHWSEVPGRDEKWKEETIANSGEEQFRSEHCCEFLGSVGTLIAPSKLKSLVYENAIESSGGLDIHEDAKANHDYLITVDVARGVEKDYSAFTVIDITSFPHKVVAKYRNNQIKPMIYPSIIVDVAKNYNNAYVFCEVNDVGDQVASIIHYDLEYTNLLMCSMRGRAGQHVGQGFSGKHTQLGVKMSKTVKKIGCLNLKTLIEEDKLFLNDYEIISELTTFIQKHNSFEAEDGCNDDLAICLVIYAWLVAQDYFKELTDQDVRKRLYEEQKNQIDQDMAPFGFILDGIDDEKTFTDIDGDRWFTDEYGDMSYMWDYR